jgi:DNA-binding MarR family transcriptional regulator
MAESPTRRKAESEVWALLGDVWFTHKPVLMEICREFDLFPPQIMVLRTLDRPKPMREVAGYLACNSSNLTGITDRLEDRKLVQRTPDPTDRRIKLLVLTPEGEELREQVVARLETPPDSLSALSDEDLRDLSRILTKLSPE